MESLEVEIIEEIKPGHWNVLLPDGSTATAGITAKVHTLKTPIIDSGEKIKVSHYGHKGFYSVNTTECKALKWI